MARYCISVIAGLIIVLNCSGSLAAEKHVLPDTLVGPAEPELRDTRSLLDRILGREEPELPAREVHGIDYEVVIEGLDAEREDYILLREMIDRTAQTIRLQSRPPASILALRHRANADVNLIRRVLSSEGYFEGEASVNMLASTPPQVIFYIKPGPRYLYRSHNMTYTPELPQADTERLRLMARPLLGAPARGEHIVEPEARVLRELRNSGRPYARLEARRAEANWDEDALDVTSHIHAGPATQYGAVSIEGAEQICADYLQGFAATLEEGAPVSQEVLTGLQREMNLTGLFNAATVEIPPAPPEGDPAVLPLSIKVQEAPHRSIGGEVTYSTIQGPGVRAFWEHRNLLCRGEKFRATLELEQKEQELKLTFDKPRYPQVNETIAAELRLFNEERNAYDARGGEGTVKLNRQVNEHLSLFAGGAFEVSQIDDGQGKSETYLLGLPLGARYDSSDNLLDPSKGIRLSLDLTPWAGRFDGGRSAFLTSDVRGSTYAALDGKARYIFAIRGRMASTLPIATDGRADLEAIPQTRRFFVGGGGSLRGYDYEVVGPFDAAGNATGGLSAFEAAAELRARVTQTVGVVPFIEAGAVSDESFGGFERIQYGAGLGLRYYSPIGPIRFDVGVPLNARDVDDSFQFYFSIGQAF